MSTRLIWLIFKRTCLYVRTLRRLFLKWLPTKYNTTINYNHNKQLYNTHMLYQLPQILILLYFLKWMNYPLVHTFLDRLHNMHVLIGDSSLGCFLGLYLFPFGDILIYFVMWWANRKPKIMLLMENLQPGTRYSHIHNIRLIIVLYSILHKLLILYNKIKYT